MSRTWPRVELAVFLVAGLSLLGALGYALVTRGPDLAQWVGSVGGRALLLAGAGVLIYLAAHALRALRLALLLGSDTISLRAIARAHFLAAGLSLLLPLKLGEVFRIVEINRLLRQPAGAVLLVWSERVLDLLTISAGILVAIAVTPSQSSPFSEGVTRGLLLTLAAVLGTFALFFVVPENIEGIKLFMIRRYNSTHSLRILAALDAVSRVITQAPRALGRRPITLIAITIAIWGLEIAALSLFLPAAMDLSGSVIVGVRLFFSHLTLGGGDALPDVISVVRPGLRGSLTAMLSAYPAAPFRTLEVVAGAIFLYTLAPRIRAAGALPRPVPKDAMRGTALPLGALP